MKLSIVKKSEKIYFKLLIIQILLFNLTINLCYCSDRKEEIMLFCRKVQGLNKFQKNFCYMHKDVVEVFIQGAKNAHRSCQKSFSKSAKTRWNCTNTEQEAFLEIPLPRDGSRELAVLSAYIGAGIAYELMSTCTKKLLSICNRPMLYEKNQESHQKFNWLIMEKMFKWFIKPENTSLNSIITNHNLKVGINIIKSFTYMKRECIDGVCTHVETLLPFTNISEKLLTNYEANSIKLKRREKTTSIDLFKYETKLIYYRNPFPYCKSSDQWRWSGTGRRECILNPESFVHMNSCRNLCCGNGFLKMSELKKHCTYRTRFPPIRECKMKKTFTYYCKDKKDVTKTFGIYRVKHLVKSLLHRA